MKVHVFRLTNGTDLRKGIEEYCVTHQIVSGCIVTCVGCVKHTCLRMAGGIEVMEDDIAREIVSLTGTMSANGSHMHISLSDISGACIGGHLKYGTLVETTAEMVIMELDEVSLTREFDPSTGYDELVVKK